MRRRDPIGEIEQLYRTDLGRFLRLAQAIVRDEQIAREVVQEAFTRAVDRRDSFRRSGPIEAWVWKIVVNEARGRARERPEPPTVDETHSENEHTDADPTIRAAVAALPERQRLAIFLRYYADLDYAAIAQALEVEVGTVSATLAAAHRSLSLSLKETVS